MGNLAGGELSKKAWFSGGANMCWVLGDLALSTGVKMSDIERFGGCVWKLFQLGTVVVLLGLGFLFFIREDE